MSQGFRQITREDLNGALEEVLFAELADVLHLRQPGHCMKVTDLDLELMVSLSRKLQQAVPASMVHILAREPSKDDPFPVTSAKVIELRNPLPDGSLRPPLLVFVPNDLRTSSEDSFSVGSFEEIRVAHAYENLRTGLLAALPATIRNAVTELFHQVAQRGWKWADLLAQVHYLITLTVNTPDDEVAGAALYELGMVPDLRFMENGSLSIGRLLKHLKCIETLTFSQKSERGRVLDLGLKDKTLKSEFAEFLAEVGLEDPAAWTVRIAADLKDRKFWFDKWSFEDGDSVTDSICLELTNLDLQYIKEDEKDTRLQNLIGEQVLTIGQKGTNRLGVDFRTTPAPSQVQGLANFQLQILSKDGMPVGITKKKAAWQTGRQGAHVTFTKLNRVDWEEGWYFVRVLAYTATGDPFPLEDAQGNPVPMATVHETGTRRPNESDLFYVIPGEDIEIDVPQRAIPRYPSLTHAAIHVRFSALSAGRNPDGIVPQPVIWTKDAESRGRRQNDVVQAKFGREGLVNIPVSHTLRVLEQRILASPDGPVSWTLPINVGNAEDATNDLGAWPATPEVPLFLRARATFFIALRAQHETAISQGADFVALRPQIVDYAASYVALLQSTLRRAETSEGEQLQSALLALQAIMAVDCVTLAIVNHRGFRKTAALVGPTHPLRALWLTTWATTADQWLQKAKTGEKEGIIPTREALIEGLGLLHFPAVLPVDKGHLLVAVDNIHPFWTLYAPPGEEDPRGLVGEVCSALGLTEPTVGSFSLNGQYMADRVRRYLIQHPYIDTLTINAFNAGRGGILADMLLTLQKRPEFANLKYNIRLFVPDPDQPEVGQDIEDLLKPGGQSVAQEADAFCSPTGNHLFPKLSLALRSTDDFRGSPGEYNSHITMLFDAFPAQDIGAEGATPRTEAAPIHGLFQDFNVAYSDAQDEIGWRRQPRHGMAKPLSEAEELTDLLSRLPALLSNAASAIATGLVGPQLLPVIKLALSAADKALIHQVHDTSDWVFTIDRNMGIEFFDHDGSGDRPEYLIDHSPQMGSSSGRRMVITSRSLTEVEALLNTVLQEHNLSVDNDRAAAVLTQLRSLSGRLALKLMSSPTNRAEALGLALARMYLDYQNALHDQIVVPLDAHLDLYRILQHNADELGNEVSLKRTDLALFDLNAASRVITCNLVEVKCYRGIAGVGALNQLMESIADQIRQSERVLQTHFDPTRLPQDRPDRLVKTQEFVTLLEFYLDRAARFNLVSPDVWDEGKYLLRTLEDGYRLNFTRSAVIFDFEKPGAEVTVEQAGIEYHRIGINLIRDLLAALPARKRPPQPDLSAESKPAESAVAVETEAHRKLDSTLPRLARAAFLSPKRDHTVVWETARRSLTTEFTTPGKAAEESVVMPVRHEPPKKPEPELQKQRPEAPPAPHEAPSTPSVPAAVPAQTAPDGDQPRPPDAPVCDVLVGDNAASLQYGLLGKVAGRTVGLDLNHPQTISLFGVQGGGKSYTLGSIVEMATMRVPAINALASPLASVIFHYSPTQDYVPEFTTMREPNNDPRALQVLAAEYGCNPQALSDIVLLAPADKLALRKAEYPHLDVRPLKFASSELGASHWKFLMGAVGNQAAYFRQLNRLMREMRGGLSLAALRDGVARSSLPDHIKELANMRLDLAGSYIDDNQRIGEILRPGRLVIVDLRDEFIEKDEALGLFVVLLQLFADTKYQGKSFNKLVVFDEAHKYIDSPDLVAGLVEVVREMRHKGTSILVASQDPPSVPVSLIELSTQIILHKFNSPAWLKHIQKANSALTNLTAEQMAHLNPGEAYLWSSKATDAAFTQRALKIHCRPRVTRHGGATRTALG
jgi:hypothetical protein